MSTAPEKWVAARLTDGLGNRLFQLAAAHQAAKLWNCSVAFAMPLCHPASHGRWDSLFRLFPALLPIWNPTPQTILKQETPSAFDHQPFPESPPADKVLLRGSWISAKYAEADFQPAWESAISESQELLSQWKLETATNRERAVFLHIRLGDYLKLPHHHVPLQNYYKRAVASFPTDTIFYVFSDEPQKAKQLLSFLEDATWVEEQDELRALFLMSSCWRGAITANSTFSWWGAFFGRQRAPPGHITCMPSRWMASDENTADVYPPWVVKINV